MQNVPWSDAVAMQRRDDSNQPDPEIETRNSFIYRRLGHLTVNPNKKGANEAITKSYVWPSNARPGVVNGSDSSTTEFVERLITAARRATQLAREQVAPDAAAAAHQATSMFIIHGGRGTGKTFFLNYILSKYWARFDSEKIVWVRLNLVANFEPQNDLNNWIAAQSTKVLLRYYDKNSKSRMKDSPIPLQLDLIGHLKEFVREKYADNPERRGEMYDKVLQLNEVFTEVRYEASLSENLVPPILAQEVMRFAREMGYAFVIALDGLDQLDVTRAAKEKFDALCRSVDAIGSAYETSGYALLVASRTKTLRNHGSIFGDPFREGNSRSLALGVVDLENIVVKRLEMIEAEVKQFAPEYEWDLSDWLDHMPKFQVQLLDKMEDISFIDSLLQSLGTNRRAQMQMIQLDYLEYTVGEKRGYTLIEYLTRAGKKYPPRYYVYDKIDDSWIHQANAEPTPFDSKFFPSLFTFPRRYNGTLDNPPHPNATLAGLRMAQILAAYSELIRTCDDRISDHMAAHELAAICEKAFGYDPTMIYLLLEEFAEFGLVELDGGQHYPLPTSADQYRIEVAPKLHFLTDTAIFDIAYLNLAAMRTPVAQNVVDMSSNTYPYFVARTFERQTIDRWIFAKIVNTVGLHGIVRRINDKQKHSFNDNMPSFNQREEVIFSSAVQGLRGIGMFDVATEMAKEVSTRLTAVLRSYERERGDGPKYKALTSRIHTHFSKWNSIE